ncbi:MAG: CorA family divalent cation transporter [bacterium]|nr:CorA family divalent cation transporter [bacterium]MDZ4296430.1 CorA family divalent cation transporter [Patescibacteria group bacterium]
MRSSFKDHIEWLLIEKPADDDFDFIEGIFALPQDIRDALRQPLLRPRFINEKSLRYTVLHVPVYHKRERHPHAVEIDLLASANAVVTIAFGATPVLTEIAQQVEKDPAFARRLLGKSTDHLLWELHSRLLDFVNRQLDHIQKKLERAEERVIKSQSRKELLEEFAILSSDILDIRRIVKPQRVVFEDLANTDGSRWEALLGEFDRLLERIENYKDSSEALYETFQTLVSMRTNEIMRVLTIIATLTFPLSLLTSLFGMNAVATPFVTQPYGFWAVTGIIVALSATMLAIFRSREWF